LVTDASTSEIHPLSLHDALPISPAPGATGTSSYLRRARGAVELGQRQAAVEQRGQALVVADEQQARTGGPAFGEQQLQEGFAAVDRKSTRLNSSHVKISYAVFCL